VWPRSCDGKARGSGRRLILAHRDALIQQAVAKLRLVDESMSIGVVKAAQDACDAPVVVASVQTLSRPHRLERLAVDFQTIVLDEAHPCPSREFLAYPGPLWGL
jgi:ATP-dependent helicase IRC3